MADPKATADQKQAADPRSAAATGGKGRGGDGEEGKPVPAQGNNQLLTLIILAVAVIAGIVSAFVLVKALAPAAPDKNAEAGEVKAEAAGKTKENAAPKAKQEGKGKSGGAEGKEGGKTEAPATLFVFEKPIVVNLAETNAERFLKVSIVLDMESQELRGEIDGKQPRLLDLLINILSSKTLDTISTPAGRNMLRQEMIDKMNAQFESGRLVNVYFTEFVIQ